jgi:hypothetical protein
MTGKVKVAVHKQELCMAFRLDESFGVDDFNRSKPWKVDDLKKFRTYRSHKNTCRVKHKLVAVAFAIYQQ